MIKINKPKHSRINYGFIGITTFEQNWWYHPYQKRWLYHDGSIYNNHGEGYSSHQSCKSLKAFKRKLKKLPSSIEFILCSRWIGYDIVGINKKNHVRRQISSI